MVTKTSGVELLGLPEDNKPTLGIGTTPTVAPVEPTAPVAATAPVNPMQAQLMELLGEDLEGIGSGALKVQTGLKLGESASGANRVAGILMQEEGLEEADKMARINAKLAGAKQVIAKKKSEIEFLKAKDEQAVRTAEKNTDLVSQNLTTAAGSSDPAQKEFFAIKALRSAGRSPVEGAPVNLNQLDGTISFTQAQETQDGSVRPIEMTVPVANLVDDPELQKRLVSSLTAGNEQMAQNQADIRNAELNSAVAMQEANIAGERAFTESVARQVQGGGEVNLPVARGQRAPTQVTAELKNIEGRSKAAGITQAQATLSTLKSLMFNEDGTLDRSNIAAADVGIDIPGVTEGRSVNSLMLNALNSVFRTESGAAVPEPEVARYMKMFQPTSFDTDQSARLKFSLLESRLGSIQEAIATGQLVDPVQEQARLEKIFKEALAEDEKNIKILEDGEALTLSTNPAEAKAQFDSLPKGALFVDSRDGVTKRKK